MLELFEKYKANPDKLQTYGFKESDGAYRFSQKIMKGDFRLEITIRDGKLDYQVFDCDTDDAYLQVKMEQVTGEFVGQVREACQAALLAIRQHCFDEIGFLYEQSKRLRDHAAEVYQGQIEYLWEKSSRKSSTKAGVFRHQDKMVWGFSDHRLV